MNIKEIKSVNNDYCNLFLSYYLKDKWGIVAGFRTIPGYLAIMRKELLDRDEVTDCDNELCMRVSSTNPTCPVGYTYVPSPNVSNPALAWCSWGGCPQGQMPEGLSCVPVTLPYTQPIPKAPDLVVLSNAICYNTGVVLNPPLSAYGFGYEEPCLPVPIPSPYIPQLPNVIVVSPPLSINQFTVGDPGGPVAGASSFTPLNSLGLPLLLNRTNIEIALGAFLQAGVDYNFVSSTGTIYLLEGRLFNEGEVYTVLSY